MTSPLLGNTQLHNMVQYDARSEILNSVGDLSEIELFGNQVIVAPYVQSGIMWSEKLGFPRNERLSIENLYALYDSGKGLFNPTAAKESIFAGMVYCVLKTGEDCVKDENGIPRLKRGDWIFTVQENTRQISVTSATAQQSRILKEIGVNYAAGWPAKMLYESDIYGRVPHQDMVL